ncbi:MAG: o-succinylbenzoate---CoA ligase [Acidimicrobiaceae bacterium]|jgi:O-succinylbenzoic acid--CoA ligase|nr:o-succinylbenzoate---CoA ligase [Acidimicrobiaceae bacterium]
MTAVLGPHTVEAMQRTWADGHAVLPVDDRLPPPARDALLDALGAGREVGDDDALVLATSGTTGAPRGVVLTFEALAAAAMATSARLDVDPDRDRWLAVLPLAHVGGLSVITRSLATGTPFTFEHDDRSATLVSVVPTQLHRGDVDPGRFRKVVVGGSADWRPAPPNAVHTYGMTETAGGVVYDGRPVDGVEVRVDRTDGQVLLRGPMLLRCYRDGTDPKTADGWLPTGDAGRLDDDGRLVVLGRMDDVIVTGGEKVWPDAVERVLRSCPGVAEVAVAGRADDEWGTRVAAFVVPVDWSAPPTLDGLRDAVKAVMPAYAAPKELVLLATLPRTALGKVRRRELEDIDPPNG